MPMRSRTKSRSATCCRMEPKPRCPPADPPQRILRRPKGRSRSSNATTRFAPPNLETPHEGRGRQAAVVHVGLGLGEHEGLTLPLSPTDQGLAPVITDADSPGFRDPVQQQKPEIVPRALVSPARIAQAYHEFHAGLLKRSTARARGFRLSATRGRITRWSVPPPSRPRPSVPRPLRPPPPPPPPPLLSSRRSVPTRKPASDPECRWSRRGAG